ncbi:DUF1150 family protein [Aestuariibius sp. HNIBRBA575]|uniref:DUF1150 family protein n=1 Tax=Aestuariibius sp. HNIBRBA575 TaxID=3233343 RepID=UPI0034A416A9
MEMKLDLGPDGERIAYMKPVNVSDLPEELQDQAGTLDIIYSVHNAVGAQIALIADRQLALDLADEYDVSLLTLH